MPCIWLWAHSYVHELLERDCKFPLASHIRFCLLAFMTEDASSLVKHIVYMYINICSSLDICEPSCFGRFVYSKYYYEMVSYMHAELCKLLKP
jgi:hypothetical protein